MDTNFRSSNGFKKLCIESTSVETDLSKVFGDFRAVRNAVNESLKIVNEVTFSKCFIFSNVEKKSVHNVMLFNSSFGIELAFVGFCM